jgi:hypothetical protein
MGAAGVAPISCFSLQQGESAAFFYSRPSFLREEHILGCRCFTFELEGAE